MSHYDETPSEPPPSYDDAMNDTQVNENHNSSQPAKPVSGYPRPPSHPQSAPQSAASPPVPSRPDPSNYGLNGSGNHQNPSQGPGSLSGASNLYSNNPLLPFLYPRGHYCKKCKNTGYKDTRGKPCSDCWKLLFRDKQAYNPNPNLPFRYPNRYLCEKCLNTGKKWKSGLMCLSCYERFAPRNNFTSMPAGPAGGFGGFGGFGPMGFLNLFGGYSYQDLMIHLNSIRVPPGDPRLGGVLCGRCRGSGVVTFFLDQDPCPVCAGLGRILNVGYQ